MFAYTLKYDDIISQRPKVIFDTNAYRNFVKVYLTNGDEFTDIVSKLKRCESNYSIVPSSNLLTIMELYQHLNEDDKAYEQCEKAILFSFERSFIDKSFRHQPLPAIEISSRIFNQISDVDNSINSYFLQGHLQFCIENRNLKSSANEAFIMEVCNRIQSYKKTFFSSIVNNLERLFSNFDINTLKFSKEDYEVFKEKYGNNRFNLYANLGHSLFDAFAARLHIADEVTDKNKVITQLICDYRPAFLAVIMILEKFSNNRPTSQTPFVPDKNDLIDALILFSVVPDENIVLVTDEKMIHQIFKEIGRTDFIYKLEDYLEKIGFKIPTS
jgi:hypothetical protein